MLTADRLDKIVERIMQLQPSSQPLWGKMSVNTMFYHCNIINNQIFNNDKTRPALLKEIAFKLVFYIMKKLPKGIKTASKYLPQQQDDLIFEQQREAFIKSVNLFRNQSVNLVGLHPIFGPLKTIEWRRFVWMHTDHHLRQFSV